ncbi:hypothetical protein [Klebsiella aerogenes]|uniref:hypothetical protein n=1 Tax=Klebsiella aerogenes TaxID=548 RepID=UPI0012DFC8A1|nr:hypothetical protein [Klebsiella aerogenes]
MQDYIVFGHGYAGDVRQFEDNLEVVRVVSKPVLMRAGDETPPGAELRFYHLNVHLMECNGKRYNVAADVIPTQEELQLVVIRECPTPVPCR